MIDSLDEDIILIVEGNDDLGEITTTYLGNHGFITLSADSGKEAIEIVSDKTDKIKLALIDINLVDSNGIDIANLIRDISPIVEIIFTSGMGPNSDLFEKMRPIKGAFLMKPYRLKELEDIIRDKLHKSYSIETQFVNSVVE